MSIVLAPQTNALCVLEQYTTNENVNAQLVPVFFLIVHVVIWLQPYHCRSSE